MNKKKPPLGLMPKPAHDYNRTLDIEKAICRYLEAGKKIPIPWVEEYNELTEEYNGT